MSSNDRHNSSTPATSETVTPGQDVAGQRREIDRQARIKLQGDQSEDDFQRGGMARPRATQDWTPFYQQLITNAGKYAALEGGSSADQKAITEMLIRPDPEKPRDPDYQPSPEALELITKHDEAAARALEAQQAAEAAPEDKEASLTAREAALEVREAAVKAAEYAAKERDLNERERALAEREQGRGAQTLAPRKGDDIEDGLRRFKPTTSEYVAPPVTSTTSFSGRQRMSPELREQRAREGMELFGIDPTENSAWSKGVPGSSPERPKHVKSARIYPDTALGRAERMADELLETEDQEADEKAARQAALDEQVAYEKRQEAARQTIKAFYDGDASRDL